MDALLCLLILQASDGNHIDAVITSLKNTKFGKMWENFSGKYGGRNHCNVFSHFHWKISM